MNLNQWAIKHSVSFEALQELRVMMGTYSTDAELSAGSKGEQSIQNNIRLEASKKGLRLWRNNVGATYDADGRFIRYGLANDSERINKVVKSSDLIGIRPISITREMIGGVIGQFVAREVKKSNWEYTGTKREQAQLNFLQIVLSMGGDAAFANNVGTL